MADKTLLILGNGFDKAHKLKPTKESFPTGYTDFLDYVKENHEEAFNTIYKIRVLDGYNGMGKPKYKKGSNFSVEIANQKAVAEISNLLLESKFEISLDKINLYIDKYTNFWLWIFEERRNNIGKLWMDFESEIAHVIQFLEYNMLHKEVSEECQYVQNFIDFKNLSIEKIQTKLIPHLELDLQYLMLLLEKYLIDKVDGLGLRNLSAVPQFLYENKNIEAILSYNYTHTFEHVYPDLCGKKPAFPIFYIHGELGKHNIVLGAGETLDDKDVFSMVWCNLFKKYFQTIYFHLDNEYQEILDDHGTKIEPKYDVIIYGHSLDVTDKDSLELVFDSNLVDKISIYYYDNSAFKRQIMNAIQILGKDKLTKWVARGKLCFLNVGK